MTKVDKIINNLKWAAFIGSLIFIVWLSENTLNKIEDIYSVVCPDRVSHNLPGIQRCESIDSELQFLDGVIFVSAFIIFFAGIFVAQHFEEENRN